MTALFVLILAAAALLAGAFVFVPGFKASAGQGRRRHLAAILAAVAVIAGGAGFYALLGRPDYALLELRGMPREDSIQEAVILLSQRIRERPNDVQGWTILGRTYSAFGEAGQAARAFQRAVNLAEAQSGIVPGSLLVDYAVALASSSGELSDEVVALLRRALQVEPTNADARYLLGLVYAERGDAPSALALWEGLLEIAPPDAPWREALPLQIAALRGEAPAAGAAPDIRAMVDGLAARLEEEPDDLEGWLMLIRAYAVLGEADNALAAVANARSIFAGDTAALAAIEEQARASALE